MKRLLYSRDEIGRPYNVAITLCKDGYMRVREYKKPIKAISQGWEVAQHRQKQKSDIEQLLEESASLEEEKEIAKRDLNRTKNTLIEYASHNCDIWKSFITLTFERNLKDLTEANAHFQNFVRCWRRKKPSFAYIAVPEFQRRGAVHYHMITNLEMGVDIPKRKEIMTYNKDKKRRYKIEYYDIPYWNDDKGRLGFSSAMSLSMTDENFNVAIYMCKYLFKDIDKRLFGRKKILKSNNLAKPDRITLMNNEVYNKAIQYLIEKGYLIEEYQFETDEKFIPEFKQLTAKLQKNDISGMQNLINEERKQNGNFN